MNGCIPTGMNLSMEGAAREDTVATSERIDRLEHRCQQLETLMDELLTRIWVLEQPQVKLSDTAGATPVVHTKETAPIDELLGQAKQADSMETSPFVTSLAELSIGTLGNSDVAQGIDVDDLLMEAVQVGKGVYDDDVKELLDMYTDQTAPTETLTIQTAPGASPVSAAPAAPVGPAALAVVSEEELGDLPADQLVTDRKAEYHPGGNGAQGGTLHLILGDSIAVYVTLPVTSDSSTLNLAVRGNTWSKENVSLDIHLREWELEAAARNSQPGKVFLWLGGNDVYGRPGDAPRDLWHGDMCQVLERLQNNDVVLAGPTPRLWADADKQYEKTAAFRADEILKRAAQEYGIRFIPYVGRALTCMQRRQHVVRGDVARSWYARDGVHLSQEGYKKVEKKLGNVLG